jgi:hypothetical protein
MLCAFLWFKSRMFGSLELCLAGCSTIQQQLLMFDLSSGGLPLLQAAGDSM